MPNLRATIVNNLVATTTPAESVRRREELRRMPNPAKRSVALMLHEITARHPNTVARLLDITYTPANVEYIDSGFRAHVFRNGADVIKIVNRSHGMSPTQQLELAERQNDEFSKLSQFLGSLTVPQHVSVQAHPVVPEVPFVTITQPFKKITDPKLFMGNDQMPMHKRVEQLEIIAPGSVEQLKVFVEGSRNLFDAYALLPDTGGFGNVVIDMQTKSLAIIDGEPIGTDNPDTQSRILSHLDQLEAVL